MHLDPTMSALEAIALSERENRIVHLRYSSALAADLFADSDGEAEDTRGIHEYWGADWRVHLHRV